MRSLALVPALSVALLAAGCGRNFLDLSSSTWFDQRNRSAIVVFRVSPKTYVLLSKGIVERDGWRAKLLKEAAEFWAEDGFVVARVKPTKEDEAYGIVRLRPEIYKDLADEPAPTYATARWSQGGAWGNKQVMASFFAVGSQGYFPDTHVRLPAFTATAGQVTYVGAVRVDASVRRGSTEPPKKISVTPVTSPTDVSLVGQYLKKHYPNVVGEVVSEPFRMLRRNEYLD
jgi:hypothetical protein